MDKKEIENIITDFLAAKSIKFSVPWKTELVKRLRRLKDKNPIQYVGTIHDAMIKEMVNDGKFILRGKFFKYSIQDAEDISQDGFIRWFRSFDATKSKAKEPEHHWFSVCIATAQIVWHEKKYPTIETVIKLDEDGNPVLNKKGEAKLEKIRAEFYSIIENANDSPDENDEEFTPSDFMLTDKAEGLSEEDIETPEKETTIETSFENSKVISELASDSIIPLSEDTKKKTKQIKLGEKTFSINAGEEIIKYYLLSGRIEKGKIRSLPKIKTTYKPLKKSIPYQVKKEFDNLSDASVLALNRFQYLKNAEKRKWMELAINEMRKSKEKMELQILKLKKDNPSFDEIKFRQNTPILSSVALNKNESIVATCFKGMVDTTHKGKDVTFDNHCEFSLFTDVINKENFHSVQGGTLYVTLEPCNKRGFWLDGEKEEPKIPCAVRCIEAGIKKVFIGSIDDNKAVYKKGKEILETGKYTFYLKDGNHTGTEKEIEAAQLLESQFKNVKNYPSEIFADKIVYKVGEPVEVHDFESDLIEEVRRINSNFLQRHSPTMFRN